MNINDTSTGATGSAPVPAVLPAHRSMPATPCAVFEMIEQMDLDIRFATSGEDLVRIHGAADYYRSVAKLRKLWRFQVEFSLRVADAERAIVKAFPALTPQEAAARRGRDDVSPSGPEGISPSVLSKMRAAHVELLDEAYLCIRADAQRKGEVLTRQKLAREARKARGRAESGPVERSPDHDIVEGIRRSIGALVSRHNLCGIVVVAYVSPNEDPQCVSKAGRGWVIDPSPDALVDARKVFALCPEKGEGSPPTPLPRDAEKDYWLSLRDYYGERMRRQHRTPERVERHIDFDTAEKQARGLFKRKFDYWPAAGDFPFALGLRSPSQGTRDSIRLSWAVFHEERALAKRLARENLASRPHPPCDASSSSSSAPPAVPVKSRTSPDEIPVEAASLAADLSSLLVPFGSSTTNEPIDDGVDLGEHFDTAQETEYAAQGW